MMNDDGKMWSEDNVNLLTIQHHRYWSMMCWRIQIALWIKCKNGCRNIFVASNEEMSSQEGEAAQSEDQDDPEDGGQGPSQDQEGQGPEDHGQGSAQDENHDEEQSGIQDDVQPDDGQDAADEMLGDILPNGTEN